MWGCGEQIAFSFSLPLLVEDQERWPREAEKTRSAAATHRNNSQKGAVSRAGRWAPRGHVALFASSLSQLPAAILKSHGSPVRGSMTKPKLALSSPSGQRSRALLSSGALWSLIPRLHRLHIRVPTRHASSIYIPRCCMHDYPTSQVDRCRFRRLERRIPNVAACAMR